MSQSRPYKRKMLNLTILRDMQIRMISRITLLLFVCLLLSSMVYFFFSNREVTASFKMFHIHAKNFLDFLLPMVLGSFFVSLIIGVVASLFFPKNIVGGLYRIEREVERITDGDLTVHITLRKADVVRALAGRISKMVDQLRVKMLAVSRGVEEARSVCAAAPLAGAAEQQEILEILDKIQAELHSLKLS
ncbi:MAG: hypothetical protein AUK28_09790 [Desulfobacterales bacterium CG2_30_60_27]|nr:MAG: hypothetical protein AUK28_09790 [Desulfobacterales bacterium CG2_30_60_27]